MKKLISLLLILSMVAVPFMAGAEDVFDVNVEAVCETNNIEVGDQFMVSFKKSVPELEFLTFRINGTFDGETAEVIAPVYTNEVLGILTNNFDNEKGTFTFEGYDQRIKGTSEDVICSILFEAKKSGEFKVNLEDDCMLGKANENAFYKVCAVDAAVTINADTDGKDVSIIKEPEPLTPYDDMLGYDWAEKAVGVMYDLGVLENIADKSYYPAQNITRGEFITMLMKVCKQNKSTEGIEPFNDVDKESYQYEQIMTAKALGIAKGDENGNFRPDETITRQDISALVFRTMLKMKKARTEIIADDYIGKFADKDLVAEYAKDSMAGVIRAKLIISDEQGLLRPADNMTRAEAAVLLNRLAEYNILIGGF